MTDEHELCFESRFRLLICKTHGFGVHPTPQAIVRHLRGNGHRRRGEALKRAVATLTKLPLGSLEELQDAHPSVQTQPLDQPIAHLKVLNGWTCIPCNGQYLTTSIELVQRHATAVHRRARGDRPLWESCSLQTFFQETKDRRYFRVVATEPTEAAFSNGDLVQQVDSHKPAQTKQLVRRGRRMSNACVFRKHPTNLKPSLALHHPLADRAKFHVPWLSTTYLDQLFKSGSLRSASEPLFDSSHIDADSSMQAVFPSCDEEPLFYYALLYSMVRFATRGVETVEERSLREATVNLLNERLSSFSAVRSPPVVGAILILKTTAYKCQDRAAHEIHSHGLRTVLGHCDEFIFSRPARRALFWQDVYAAVFLDCQRQITSSDLFDTVRWQRELHSNARKPSLPAGFTRYEEILPEDLLDCVIDLLELKSYLPILAQLPYQMRYQLLDSMQASIEARIVKQSRMCRELGPVVEATRLGIFICCYCAWMEVWNDSLVPCKLAEKLIEVLEPTLTTEGFARYWKDRLDLVLWLLLIASSVVELDQGHIENLKLRRRHLLFLAKDIVSRFNIEAAKIALRQALHNFVYCDEWLWQRSCVKEWRELESSVGK